MIKTLYNWLFKPKIKDKLVGIIRIDHYSSYYHRDYTVAYHLFESNKGKRYYKPCGFSYDDDYMCTTPFVTIIQPWLDGLNLPEEYKINI